MRVSMDIVSAKEIPAIKTFVPRLSQDQRGVFAETWREDLMHEAGLASHFVQDNHVITHDAGTIRGLHFQTGAAAQAKVVRCIRGSVLDVAADIRNGSPTYGKYVAVLLTSNNWTQLYIPVGFAHGYCTVEPNSEVLYKVSTAYDPAAE